MTIQTKRRRAVLLDLDDTLYTERDYVRSGFRAVGRFLSPVVGRRAAWIAARLDAMHDRDGRGRLFDDLLLELGMSDDPDLVPACLLVYRTHRPRLNASPGVVDSISALRAESIHVGLISDGLASVQYRKLKALNGVARQLDLVVMTDELGPGMSKPSPVPFRVACQILGVTPEHAVYVGNDPRKDFAGARAAGLRTIRTGRDPDEGGGTNFATAGPDDADETIRPFSAIVPAILGRSTGGR